MISNPFKQITLCAMLLLLLFHPSVSVAGSLKGTNAKGANLGVGPQYAGAGAAAFFQHEHHRVTAGVGVLSPHFAATYSYIIWGVGKKDQFLPMIDVGYAPLMDGEGYSSPFIHLVGEYWFLLTENSGLTIRLGGGVGFNAEERFMPNPSAMTGGYWFGWGKYF